jgi:hypothetical protein
MEERDIVNGNIRKADDYRAMFEKFISSSGLTIESWTVDNYYKGFVDITTTFNGGDFMLHIHFRNITGAHLPYDMTVRRIQIGPLDAERLPQNTHHQVSMLAGFCFVGSEPIFGAWNPFYFCEHKKNRSCYIRPGTILAAEKTGFYAGMYNNISVYACDSKHFQELLKIYIGENSVA